MNNINKKKYEMIVGYFFLAALLLIVSVVIFFILRGRINLFRSHYYAYYKSASGLRNGTVVTINGIVVGEVTLVDIDELNRIKVKFEISERYKDKIKNDSVAKIVRPLLIGNKQIQIIPGNIHSPLLKPGSKVLSEESSELIDLVSGSSLQEFIDKYQIKSKLFDASSDGVDGLSVRELYDQAVSALITLNEFQQSLKSMGSSMEKLSGSLGSMQNSFRSIDGMVKGLDKMSDSMTSLNAMTGELGEFSKSMNDINRTFKELNKVMGGLSEGSGTISESVPQIKRLLNEMEVLLMALQNNWMFKKEVDMIKKDYDKQNQDGK